MALTGKKRAFADAKLAGLSNKDAAIAAGYSPKTASAAGSRLVKDPAVEKYLADQAAAIRARAQDKPAAAAPPSASPPERPAFDLEALTHYSDPKAFLKAVMNEPMVDMKQRVEAAKTLMPFEHQKKGEGGKKDAKDEAAKQAANKFAGTPAPGIRRVK
jgi:phage terminase small subunit